MKKKNIYKKLMSAILSATTMFALLTMPAHAIVPGEDAYSGQEEGYIRVDFENQTTEFISKSAIPNFTGNGTYDVLNTQDREKMDFINAQIAESQQNIILPNGITDGTFDIVDPGFAPYSGTVLVVNMTRGSFGSGFMVDGDTLITALHVLYKQDPISKEIIISDTGLPELRVYFGVNLVNTTVYDLTNSNYPYISISSAVFSNAVITGQADYMYDWAVCKLENEKNNVYFYDCERPDNNLMNTSSYILGYPSDSSYTLKMVRTTGYIYTLMDSMHWIDSTNRCSSGMSGGPLYVMDRNQLKCYGIHVYDGQIGIDSGLYGSSSIYFYDDLLSVIATCMNE